MKNRQRKDEMEGKNQSWRENANRTRIVMKKKLQVEEKQEVEDD